MAADPRVRPSPHRRVLLWSVALSAAYAATFAWGAFPGAWAVKALAIAVLAVPARHVPLLCGALLLGSVGDALLDLDPRLFTPGLGAFLGGHVLYALCFWQVGRPARARAPRLLIGLAAAALLAWLWPALGALRLPVAAYFVAITTMALASFRVGGWASVGALLFLASDALLATDRFRMSLPLRDWLVWGTYYGAQVALATGVLRARPAAPAPGLPRSPAPPGA